jgi:hypothetical protein
MNRVVQNRNRGLDEASSLLGFRQDEMNEDQLAYSPPFERRGARAIQTLDREGGVVSKSRAASLDVLEAHLILLGWSY